MTNEEAIKRIDYARMNCNDLGDCDLDCDLCDNAMSMAVESLFKQIPQYVDDKRTNAEEVGQVGYDFCPKCGALVTRNYCENCGQAVKYYRYEISEDENGTQYWKRMAQDD